PPDHGAVAWADRVVALIGNECRVTSIGRDHMCLAGFELPDQGILRLEKTPSALRDRIEDRVGIGRRATYDVEDLPRRSLMFERFRRLPPLRLHLVEQPHVLDRDHRL